MMRIVDRRGTASIGVGVARAALRRAGRLSSTLPFAAMVVGLLVPSATDMLFAQLPLVSAATVFCGLMAMEAGAGLAADWRIALRLLPLLSLLAAAPAWAIGMLLGAGPEASAWMALMASAPVSALAVANTASLGLPARAIALLVLVGTLAAPLTLPLVAWIFAAGTRIGPVEVAQRAMLVVLVPAVLAFGLRRIAPLRDGAILTRADWRGITTLSLMVLALARMHQIGPQIGLDPAGAAWAALLGCVSCGTGALLALLMPGPAGWRGGVLAGGCRGGALVWALTAPFLPPAGHLFMALTILPIYGIPVLVTLLGRFPGTVR